MPTTPDQLNDLIQRVAAADRVAFSGLYSATSAKLYGIVLRILKRRDLADEVLQETYIRIWNNARSFDPGRASAITWMATIARNRALDEVRKVRPVALDDVGGVEEIEDPAMLVSEQMELNADYARLQTCLEALEPQRRDIVKLAYLEGRSREELGQLFGHPAATIKTWLHRSLKQLRNCLST
jgi:RNA polymerase sigma-70 factor (ECF subfamily)